MGEESLTQRLEEIDRRLLEYIHTYDNKGFKCPIMLGVLFNICHDTDIDPRTLVEDLYVEKLHRAITDHDIVLVKSITYGFATGATSRHISALEHCRVCDNNQSCSTSVREYRDTLSERRG